MTVDLKEIYLQVRDELEGKVEFPSFEGKEIVKFFFRCSSADILLGKTAQAEKEQEKELNALLSRRKAGEPLQYLLGEWDFYGRKFFVGEGVLIPRGDTETIIEAALPYLRQNPQARVLDLCSGSGCIAITLAEEVKTARVTAVELSPQAFAYLQKNNALYGGRVTLVLGDALLPSTAEGEFSLILANPPYLTKEEMNALQKEVTFEPEMALYGKEDGLFFYKELAGIYYNKLAPDGMIAFEIGDKQEQAVTNILLQNGYDDIEKINDHGKHCRVVTAKKKGNR